MLQEKFLIDWADKNIKLDKDSGLYDKKADRKLRESCENFIEFLKKDDSSDDDDSGSDADETKEESTKDTAAEKEEQERLQKEKE